jgi:CHRD domain
LRPVTAICVASGGRQFGINCGAPRLSRWEACVLLPPPEEPELEEAATMRKCIHLTVAGFALAATLSATPVKAEMQSYKADLKATSEVPPTTSQGTGTLTATFDTASKKLSWKGTVSGLSGNATAAHFHGPTDPGKNAGVLVPAPGVTTGSFEGSATLTDDQAKALMNGQTYFNVHTAANPAGEVRGQVVKG